MRRQKKVVPANSRKLGFGHNSLMGFAASKQTIYIVSGSSSKYKTRLENSINSHDRATLIGSIPNDIQPTAEKN